LMPLQGQEGGQTNNQQSAQRSYFKLLLQQNNVLNRIICRRERTKLASLIHYLVLIPHNWCCVGNLGQLVLLHSKHASTMHSIARFVYLLNP
jgi:hypothetical protein